MAEHKHAAVLRAIADGKKVEYYADGGGWSAPWSQNPISHEHLEWRIKPEPKPDVVTFDFVRRPGHEFSYSTEESARRLAGGNPILRLVWEGEDSTKLKSAEVLP